MEGERRCYQALALVLLSRKDQEHCLQLLLVFGRKNLMLQQSKSLYYFFSFLKTDQEMDQGENKIQLFGIFNQFLCYIMSLGCPVCYSLYICRWLFNLLKDTAAEIAGQIYMIMSLNLSLRKGFLIVSRLYEFVVQSLASEAIKPVTLGDTNQSRSNSDNGNHSSNEHVLHSEDSSSRVVPKLEEAVVEDDSVLKNGESDPSQATSEENEGDKIVEEEAPGPSMETQNKAPKKMVSINDNVEEICFSKKKKKKKSTEKVPSIKEQVKKELKPLKSILKVGSNVNENWDEKQQNS